MTRSTAELIEVSVHLRYELHMLEATARALAEAEVPLKYALIESFAVHARVLLEFLYRKRGDRGVRDSDVLACDFCPGWQAPPIPAVLERVPHRTGKEIVHLTYDRNGKTPEEWLWPVPAMRDAILIDMEKFLNVVPTVHLHSGSWAISLGRPTLLPRRHTYSTFTPVSSTAGNTHVYRREDD